MALTNAAEGPVAKSASAQRVQLGLQALYDLRSFEGDDVKDRSGAGQPLDLQIDEEQAVTKTAEGMKINRAVLLHTKQPAVRLIDAVKKSGAISIEAWMQPANTSQKGPARIVTLSRNPGERNFTLGQDGNKVEFRLRTTETTANGMPALATKSKALGTELAHLVYTRNPSGRARIYINGRVAAEGNVGGTLANWDADFHLALANELSKDRPWQGTLRLVAVYSRELTHKEVEQNFHAGPTATAAAEGTHSGKDDTRLFETSIAPILSKHCLECHDTVTKQGKLDLSRKTAALAGGERGRAIVPHKAAESLLWQRVERNEMPHDRPPLSQHEKGLLRQWLDAGAPWSLAVIDPVVYAHGGGANKVFVQRLTVPEYIESVRAILGVDIAQDARALLPRDLRADGFSNTAYNLHVDLAHVDAYARLAEMIVGRIDMNALAKRYTQSRELSDENLTKIIAPLGRLVLRGPLSKQEITDYCGISTTVAANGGSFEDAVGYILQAMLQSPRFLYRIENQPGAGPPTPVGPYELASRLSFILWGGPPDEVLLQAAEKNALDRRGVKAQVERMLQDPRAVTHSLQFVTEWLNLDRLDNLRPSSEKYPHWEPELAADMRQETLAFFQEIAWTQNRPLSDLFNAQVTFVTPRLAKHYGLPEVKQDAKAGESMRYDLSAVPGRRGLLTQGSVLTVGGEGASTVTRGLFVMHELLRGVVRDPPPCVDTTPIPTKPGLSKRAIAESRLENKNCSGCHVKFEPLAFGLEKFDGLGVFHENDEHGNKLRDDGQILFPGEEKPVSYRSTAEYVDLLANSDRVRESLTSKVTQFALGRPLGAEDAPIVAEIHRAAQQAGGTYANLLTAIVLSDLIQTTRSESAPSASDH